MEGRYRTHPYRILVGHSFGGLFVTQVLIEDPEAFDAYLSISPSLWWDERRFVSGAASIFEGRPELEGALYMTMGNEGGDMLAGAWDMAGVLETKAPEGFRWKWVPMPGEDHGSVPHRSTYDGLEWVFDGWNLPELFTLATAEGGEGWEEVLAHYRGLSERFGFHVKIREGLVNQVGYFLLREDRVDDAITAFELNTELYPGSANTFDSLGDAYDAACRWNDALEAYSRAHGMAVRASGEDAARYKTKLDRITEKIESGEACPSAPARSP